MPPVGDARQDYLVVEIVVAAVQVGAGAVADLGVTARLVLQHISEVLAAQARLHIGDSAVGAQELGGELRAAGAAVGVVNSYRKAALVIDLGAEVKSLAGAFDYGADARLSGVAHIFGEAPHGADQARGLGDDIGGSARVELGNAHHQGRVGVGVAADDALQGADRVRASDDRVDIDVRARRVAAATGESNVELVHCAMTAPLVAAISPAGTLGKLCIP